jgi:hypothetical protein
MLVTATPFAGMTVVQASSPLPPLNRSGEVECLGGGIGQDEDKAIGVESRYGSLRPELAVRDGRRADFAAHMFPWPAGIGDSFS